MKVNLQLVILFLMASILFGCNTNKKNRIVYVPINDDDNYGYYENNVEEQMQESTTDDLLQIQLTGVLETCNKCMGYGSVQDGLYGTPQICKFCWVSTWMFIQQGWTGFNGRYGVVDAAFNKLPANYFDKLDMNGHNEMSNNGEIDRNQIEEEIGRCERNVSEMERQLEYVDGTVYRSYLQQQITAEKIKIRQLKEALDRLE